MCSYSVLRKEAATDRCEISSGTGIAPHLDAALPLFLRVLLQHQVSRPTLLLVCAPVPSPLRIHSIQPCERVGVVPGIAFSWFLPRISRGGEGKSSTTAFAVLLSHRRLFSTIAADFCAVFSERLSAVRPSRTRAVGSSVDCRTSSIERPAFSKSLDI